MPEEIIELRLSLNAMRLLLRTAAYGRIAANGGPQSPLEVIVFSIAEKDVRTVPAVIEEELTQALSRASERVLEVVHGQV